jgi:hypothetical protein
VSPALAGAGVELHAAKNDASDKPATPVAELVNNVRRLSPELFIETTFQFSKQLCWDPGPSFKACMTTVSNWENKLAHKYRD